MTDFLGGTANVNPLREPVLGHEACSPPPVHDIVRLERESAVARFRGFLGNLGKKSAETTAQPIIETITDDTKNTLASEDGALLIGMLVRRLREQAVHGREPQ